MYNVYRVCSICIYCIYKNSIYYILPHDIHTEHILIYSTLQVVDDIVILRITNGNDFFCIINATLTADTCAAVCTAYARLGNRKSDFSHSCENSPIKTVRQTEIQTVNGNLTISHKNPR